MAKRNDNYKQDLRLVAIEGNIGSGKSTALSELKDRGYTVVKEPIEHWSDALNLFYTDPEKYSFLLQTRILTELIHAREQALKDNKRHKDNLVFFERSQKGAKTFVEVSRHNGNMNPIEYATYFKLEKAMFKTRSRLQHGQVHIIIDTPPSVCCARTVQRNRSAEQDGPLMSTDIQKLAYMQQLHDMHEIVFPRDLHVRVNGLHTPDKVADEILHSLYKCCS